jgi:hypothetical protein
MNLQIPLMIIDRRSVSIMSILFTNRRVTLLKFVDALECIRNAEGNIGQHRDCFEKYQNCFEVNCQNCFGCNKNIPVQYEKSNEKPLWRVNGG